MEQQVKEAMERLNQRSRSANVSEMSDAQVVAKHINNQSEQSRREANYAARAMLRANTRSY